LGFQLGGRNADLKAMAKYASVYARERSPFWWISYWHPKKQKRIHEATPYRRDAVQSKRKALDLADEKSKQAGADKSETGRDRWERWVSDFIADRYPVSSRKKTHDRMLGAWRQWREFLRNSAVHVPRGLTYNGVLDYVKWRSSQVKPSSGKRVSKNTALCDVRLMAVVMDEARRRGFADTNPCDRLGIAKDPAKEKREFSDAEIDLIRRELRSRPDWMQVAFEIAIFQGCRLRETAMPLTQIDLQRSTIMFLAKGRGGKKHVFTTRLHDGLRSLIESLIKAGRSTTCDMPVMASKDFHFFFKEVGIKDACFHCTRVTVVTRLARAGVPVSIAMAYVGHASETIHRIYQKLQPADAAPAVAAIQPGTGSAGVGSVQPSATLETAITAIQPGSLAPPPVAPPVVDAKDALIQLVLSDPVMSARLGEVLKRQGQSG
jgi:hypothetical protein